MYWGIWRFRFCNWQVSVGNTFWFNFFISSRNNSVHPTTQTNPIPHQVNSVEIPLRATIISILLFIPYFLTYIILGIQKLDPLEKYFFVIILTRIQDTLRNPLIAKFLFNINDENRQCNALEERERNQQREIQDALKRRQLRQEAKMTNESRYHINISDDTQSTSRTTIRIDNVIQSRLWYFQTNVALNKEFSPFLHFCSHFYNFLVSFHFPKYITDDCVFKEKKPCGCCPWK